MIKSIFLGLINFYQRFISPVKINSCRYYPTCSSYAKLEFEHNGFIRAFINSLLRILRCNQLFKGGIDHPLVNSKLSLQCNNKKIKVKYWFIKKNKNRYFVIKSFK